MWWENPPQTLSAIVTSINIKHWHPAWCMEICIPTHRTLFYGTSNGGRKNPKLFKHWMQRSDKSGCDEERMKNEQTWGEFVRWAEEKCNSTNNDNKWIVEFLFFENAFFIRFFLFLFSFLITFLLGVACESHTGKRVVSVLPLALRNINKVEPFLCQ